MKAGEKCDVTYTTIEENDEKHARVKKHKKQRRIKEWSKKAKTGLWCDVVNR
jgi:adenosyl cobinamide kinase/adenosyl cobinamide phosphate guanylyltransferase